MATSETPQDSTGEFLTDDDLQKLLHVSWRTTLRWRTDGSGPPFIRIGARRIVYECASVNTWLASRTHKHRAAEAAVAA